MIITDVECEGERKGSNRDRGVLHPNLIEESRSTRPAQEICQRKKNRRRTGRVLLTYPEGKEKDEYRGEEGLCVWGRETRLRKGYGQNLGPTRVRSRGGSRVT